jgi:hypothetical protein
VDVDEQPSAVDASAVPAPNAGPAEAQHTASVRVAAALAPLAGLEVRPLAEHVESYQRVHAELQAVLAELDSA